MTENDIFDKDLKQTMNGNWHKCGLASPDAPEDHNHLLFILE